MSDVRDIIKAQWDASQRGLLTLWTIYDRPKDHPDGFIARRFESGPGETIATDHTLTGDLESLRARFERAGLVKMPREVRDEAQIVETWL